MRAVDDHAAADLDSFGDRAQIDLHLVERQGVGQGDQLGGPLRTLDAGEASHGEGVPLGQVGQPDEGLGGKQDAARGLGDPARDRLLRNVHHVGAALRIEMAEGACASSCLSGVSEVPYGSIPIALHPLQLAFVVPTLNEEDALRRHLPAARTAADEVVVSDGGSTDRTLEVARELGARTVSGPPGRGGQLTRGATATTAEVLVFLHADTSLPAAGPGAIRDAVAAGAVGGAFHVRFDVDRWCCAWERG